MFTFLSVSKPRKSFIFPADDFLDGEAGLPTDGYKRGQRLRGDDHLLVHPALADSPPLGQLASSDHFVFVHRFLSFVLFVRLDCSIQKLTPQSIDNTCIAEFCVFRLQMGLNGVPRNSTATHCGLWYVFREPLLLSGIDMRE